MHKGPELALILSQSIIQQHFPKLQFILSLKTRTNADRIKGKIHLLSLCCNVLGDCLFSNAQNNLICRNIQLLNGLSLNINKQKVTVKPNITVGIFLLVSYWQNFSSRLLINYKFCQSKQACQSLKPPRGKAW